MHDDGIECAGTINHESQGCDHSVHENASDFSDCTRTGNCARQRQLQTACQPNNLMIRVRKSTGQVRCRIPLRRSGFSTELQKQKKHQQQDRPQMQNAVPLWVCVWVCVCVCVGVCVVGGGRGCPCVGVGVWV